jgi:DNA-binding LytR/AlgR family response regulator
MNCIIIDDEPKAIDLLATFIGKVPFLNLLGKFRDPIAAMDFIADNKVDLLFLDINMPDITGIQLLKSLSNAPMVIFTTAHTEYAVESYNLNAVDYLLKPIEFERFMKAVMKTRSLFESAVANKDLNTVQEIKENIIFIKSGTKTHRIELDSILYIEGMGNYVSFILIDKKITAYMSMPEVIELLPSLHFQRIHKSYIISLKQIDTIEVHQVKIKDNVIPIGQTFRSEFFKKTSDKRFAQFKQAGGRYHP